MWGSLNIVRNPEGGGRIHNVRTYHATNLVPIFIEKNPEGLVDFGDVMNAVCDDTHLEWSLHTK